MAAPDVTVREVHGPFEVDDPDLRDSVDVFNAVMADLMGHDELATTCAETARLWRPTPYGREVRFVAEVGGRVVGRGYAGMPLSEEVDKAFVNVWVRPTHRHRGVGTALARAIARVTHDLGRTRLQTWTVSTVGADGSRHAVQPRTGIGSVPAGDPGTSFARSHGFVLHQVERVSRLDLRVGRTGVGPALSQAQGHAGPGYRVVAWRSPTPTEWLDDLAWLWSRMSTDAPHGDIAVEEQVWDAERVVTTEHRMVSEDRYLLTAAAEHVDSGRLVAFTNLTVPRDSGRAARQEITLVTREHRGHRLGLLVKAANLAQLSGLAPDVPAIYTWNAEENRPMLAVNDVLGFRGVGVEGQWERTSALDLG